MNEKLLSKCELNKVYVIKEINIEENIKKHLKNFMIDENEKIAILFKNYKSNVFIVKALGINYALGKEICEKIVVYDV